VKCDGKLKIITRKAGRANVLCSYCFHKTLLLSAKEINKMMRPRKMT